MALLTTPVTHSSRDNAPRTSPATPTHGGTASADAALVVAAPVTTASPPVLPTRALPTQAIPEGVESAVAASDAAADNDSAGGAGAGSHAAEQVTVPEGDADGFIRVDDPELMQPALGMQLATLPGYPELRAVADTHPAHELITEWLTFLAAPPRITREEAPGRYVDVILTAPVTSLARPTPGVTLPLRRATIPTRSTLIAARLSAHARFIAHLNTCYPLLGLPEPHAHHLHDDTQAQAPATLRSSAASNSTASGGTTSGDGVSGGTTSGDGVSGDTAKRQGRTLTKNALKKNFAGDTWVADGDGRVSAWGRGRTGGAHKDAARKDSVASAFGEASGGAGSAVWLDEAAPWRIAVMGPESDRLERIRNLLNDENISARAGLDRDIEVVTSDADLVIAVPPAAGWDKSATAKLEVLRSQATRLLILGENVELAERTFTPHATLTEEQKRQHRGSHTADHSAAHQHDSRQDTPSDIATARTAAVRAAAMRAVDDAPDRRLGQPTSFRRSVLDYERLAATLVVPATVAGLSSGVGAILAEPPIRPLPAPDPTSWEARANVRRNEELYLAARRRAVAEFTPQEITSLAAAEGWQVPERTHARLLTAEALLTSAVAALGTARLAAAFISWTIAIAVGLSVLGALLCVRATVACTRREKEWLATARNAALIAGNSVRPPIPEESAWIAAQVRRHRAAQGLSTLQPEDFILPSHPIGEASDSDAAARAQGATVGAGNRGGADGKSTVGKRLKRRGGESNRGVSGRRESNRSGRHRGGSSRGGHTRTRSGAAGVRDSMTRVNRRGGRFVVPVPGRHGKNNAAAVNGWHRGGG